MLNLCGDKDNIRAIENDEDLEWALQEFERVRTADEIDENLQLILGTLIGAYERKKM
jgi:antitoxin component HigA of HigAB toxin-antitoxin module